MFFKQCCRILYLTYILHYRSKWRHPRKDNCTWAQRKRMEFCAWDTLIKPLTDVYVNWKYGTSSTAPPPPQDPPSSDTSLPSDEPCSSDTSLPSNNPLSTNETSGSTPDNVTQGSTGQTDTIKYSVYVFKVFSLEAILKIDYLQTSTSVAVDLAEHGFLAKTPTLPTFAIGFRMLELFHCIRLCKPSLSIEAFTHIICDYYIVCTKVPED